MQFAYNKIRGVLRRYEQKYSPSRIKLVLGLSSFVEKSDESPSLPEERTGSTVKTSDAPETNDGSTVKNTVKNTVKIIELVRGKSSITRQEIASALGLSVEGVDNNLKKLKKEGLIRRVGPDKGGHWEIVENK